jgi:hypothetical protein
MPPEPETIKKAGERTARLRENERYRRQGAMGNFREREDSPQSLIRRTMDILLWGAFGKPKLSYQNEPESEF